MLCMGRETEYGAVKGDMNDKEALLKLLEATRISIGTNASSYPALLLMDFHKKRYYKVRQPRVSNCRSNVIPQLSKLSRSKVLCRCS